MQRSIQHAWLAARSISAIVTRTPISMPARSASFSTTAATIPTSLTSTYPLLTGHTMPAIGLGTWRSAPGEVGLAVYEALKQGYRHIDGAAVYGNETEVGRAMKQWQEETGGNRESLFVTSKLWNTDHDPVDVEPALRRSLARLGLSYLDLYLIHWPVSFLHSLNEDGEVEMYPKTKKGQTLFAPEDVPLERTWEALVHCQKQGLIRSIGASNFTSDQVIELHRKFGAAAGPVVNQVEAHPFCAQRTMQSKLAPLGIYLTAYSPLGNIHAAPPSAGIKASATAAPPPPSPMHHDCIKEIGRKHRVTPAQVLLRWNLQLGRIIIPKSVNAERIRENAQLFHFALDEVDMNAIEALNRPPTQYRFLNPTSFKRTPRKYFFTVFE